MEIVLTFVAAYNAGDLDTWAEALAPDIEVFPDVSIFPEPGPLVGRDQYVAWTKEIGSAWKSPRWDTTEALAGTKGRDLDALGATVGTTF